MSAEPATARPYDLVLFGATGFAGRLVAEHLADQLAAGAVPPPVRVALAGRSRERLAAVRDRLPDAAASWPLLVADSGDRASLDELAEQARVVVTTVGPYARSGLALVEACAAAGTSYADLTGEVLFVRQSIDRCAAAAQASGARIVHACGFDSVPSDLAVLLLAEQARADGAGELEDTTLLVTGLRGGVSGGTVDSMRLQVDTARRDPAARRLLADPYALSPDRAAEPDLGPQRDATAPGREADGRWTAPFVMAPVNTRVVRRSNALRGWAYGRRFRYREVLSAGRGPLGPLRAGAVTAGLAGLAAGLAASPTRPLVDRLLPAPGQGPGERARREGHFRMEVTARTTGGARYRATVGAQGDPGYAATAVMLGQAALSLAQDGGRAPYPGGPAARAGVLTPATALGLPLVDRLRRQGFTLTVEPD